jgi:hypothetical protein
MSALIVSSNVANSFIASPFETADRIYLTFGYSVNVRLVVCFAAW